MTGAVGSIEKWMDGRELRKENRNSLVTDWMWKENKVSRMTSTFLASAMYVTFFLQKQDVNQHMPEMLKQERRKEIRKLPCVLHQALCAHIPYIFVFKEKDKP